MWAWLRALFAYIAGLRAGEAAQQSADAAATVTALEERAKTDDQVARDGDASGRERLRKWVGRI
jgi:hypothetical protein